MTLRGRAGRALAASAVAWPAAAVAETGLPIVLRQAFALVILLLVSQMAVRAQGAPAVNAVRNEAGIVDLIEGGVTITGADRRARVLKKGDALFEGDAILTAADGELHANLTDGGVIAVRPNTQLRISRYQANGEASDTSIFNLVKGSFRSITGWIARSNPAGYLIRTPTSTLGVRGTDHEPLVIPPGAAEGEPGTYDRVHAGTSFIRGKNGSIDVAAGRAGFFAHHGRDRPRVLDRVPRFFRPARNERLLEGRHERVRQVLEQKRSERRTVIEERRARRLEGAKGGSGRPHDAGPAIRAQSGERGREVGREAFEQQPAQQQAERARQREAMQREREARQQQRHEAQQQRREGRQQHEERRERH